MYLFYLLQGKRVYRYIIAVSRHIFSISYENLMDIIFRIRVPDIFRGKRVCTLFLA